MERRLSLLFGILGGVFLILLNGPLSIALSSFQDVVSYFAIKLLTIIGTLAIVYFSILLIIDTLKTVHKGKFAFIKRNNGE